MVTANDTFQELVQSIVKETFENEMPTIKAEDISGLEEFIEEHNNTVDVDAEDIKGLEEEVEKMVEYQLQNWEFDADNVSGLGNVIDKHIEDIEIDPEQIRGLGDEIEKVVTNQLEEQLDDAIDKRLQEINVEKIAGLDDYFDRKTDESIPNKVIAAMQTPQVQAAFDKAVRQALMRMVANFVSA